MPSTERERLLNIVKRALLREYAASQPSSLTERAQDLLDELADARSAPANDEDTRLRDGLAAAYTQLTAGDVSGAQLILEVVLAGGGAPELPAPAGGDGLEKLLALFDPSDHECAGPNWTPAVATQAHNEVLAKAIVTLGLADEATVRARFAAIKAERDARIEESFDRVNAEHAAARLPSAPRGGADGDR